MTHFPVQFAINRMVAPRLPLQAFLALASRAGATAVEVRNDIGDREFADGMPARELRAHIAGAGLAVASVNALQRFNDWTPERAYEAEALFRYAAELGAPGIVLCPVIDPDHRWTEIELAMMLRQSLTAIRSLAAETGVTGYVEPLGMAGSTLQRQYIAAEAIADVDGAGQLKICYDTFQYFRCRDQQLFPELIGLVHVSGVSRTGSLPEMLIEADRGFVDSSDITGAGEQLKRIISAGYRGYVSMEPFDPEIHRMQDASRLLTRSFALLGKFM